MRTSMFSVTFVVTAALLVQSVFTGYIPEAQCAKQCISEPLRHHYTPGHTYKFRYEGSTKSALTGSQEHSGLNIQADAHLHVKSHCEHVLTLRNVRLQEDTHLGKRNAVRSETFSRYLEQNPLHYEFQDGKIAGLCAADNEPTWILNVKRGVLSSMQFTLENLEKNQKSTETDVTGECETEYTVEKRWRSISVTKTKDLKNCKRRSGINSVLQSVPYHIPGAPSSLPVLSSSHKCRASLTTSGVLQSCHCEEKHEFRPFMKQTGSSVTSSEHKLTFVESGPAESPMLSQIRRQTSLAFEHNDRVTGSSSNAEAASATLREICTSTVARKPAMFSRLVKNLRDLDAATLVDLHREVHRNAQCSTAKSMFHSALVATGTAASARVLREMALSGEISVEQAKNWISTLGFISNPDLQTIKEVRPFISNAKFGLHSMLPIAALVHTVCANRDDCYQHEYVRDVIKYFVSHLGEDCRTNSNSNVLRALKALGNAGISSGAAQTLGRCIRETNAPMEIRLAAVQAFRRMKCTENRDELMKTFKDPEEDSELRIAAYLGLMECPSSDVISRVRETLEEEPINQVGSFVWTHLTNLRESNDLFKEDIANVLANKKLNKFNLDMRKFSRNYAMAYHSKQLNAGAKGEANLIWSQKSYVPRSAMLNLTVNMFGHSVNALEMGGRVEGLEKTLENMFQPTKPTKRGRRSIRDQLSGVKGSGYVKVFGHEIGYADLEDVKKEAKEFNYLDALIALSQNHDYDWSRHVKFMDFEFTIPTITGLPLRMDVDGATTVEVKVQGKANLMNVMLKSKGNSIDIDGKIIPNAAIEINGVMKIDANVAESGIKHSVKMHTSTRFDGHFKVNKDKILSAKINMPEEKIEVFSAESKTFLLTNGKEEPQIPLHPMTSASKCTGSGFETALGLRMCAGWSYEATNPLLGDASVAVTLQRTDSHTAYELDFDITTTSTAPSMKMIMDTPGSTVNRRHSYEVTLFKDHTFDMTLKNPWKNIKMQGDVINRNNRKALDVKLYVDKLEMFGLETELNKRAYGKRTVYTPRMTLRLPSLTQPIELTGSATMMSDKLSGNLKLENAFRRPFVISGSVSQSLAARKRGYTLSAALNSQFITTSLTASTNLMADSYSANAKLLYNKESINFGNRIRFISRRGAVRCIGKSTLRLSQFPYYNAMLDANLMLSSSRPTAKIDLHYGANLKDNNKRLLIVTNNAFNIKPRQNKIEHSLKIRSKDLGWFVSTQGSLVHQSNLLHANFEAASAGKSISTELKLRQESTNPMKIYGDFNLNYPGRVIKLHQSIEQTGRTDYETMTTLQWQKNREMTLSVSCKKETNGRRAEIDFKMAPYVNDLSTKMSYSLTKNTFNANAQTSYEKHIYSTAVSFDTDYMKYLNSAIEVKIPQDTFTASLNGKSNVEQNSLTFNTQWAPTKSATVKLYNTMVSTIAYGVSVTAPNVDYSGSVTIKPLEFQRKYNVRVESKWAPEQQIVLDVIGYGYYDNGLKLGGNFELESPCKAHPKVSGDLSYEQDADSVNTKASYTWNPNKVVSTEVALKKTTNNMEGFVTMKTPFANWEDMMSKVVLSNNRRDRSFHAEVQRNNDKHEVDLALSSDWKSTQFSMITKSTLPTLNALNVKVIKVHTNNLFEVELDGAYAEEEVKVKLSLKRRGSVSLRVATPFAPIKSLIVNAKGSMSANNYKASAKVNHNGRWAKLDADMTHNYHGGYNYNNKGSITMETRLRNHKTSWNTMNLFENGNLDTKHEFVFDNIPVAVDIDSHKEGGRRTTNILLNTPATMTPLKAKVDQESSRNLNLIRVKLGTGNKWDYTMEATKTESDASIVVNNKVLDLEAKSKVNFAGQSKSFMAEWHQGSSARYALNGRLINTPYELVANVTFESPLKSYEYISGHFESNKNKNMLRIEYQPGKVIEVVNTNTRDARTVEISSPCQYMPMLKAGYTFWTGDEEEWKVETFAKASGKAAFNTNVKFYGHGYHIANVAIESSQLPNVNAGYRWKMEPQDWGIGFSTMVATQKPFEIRVDIAGDQNHAMFVFSSSFEMLKSVDASVYLTSSYNRWGVKTEFKTEGVKALTAKLNLNGKGATDMKAMFESNCPHMRKINAAYMVTASGSNWELNTNANINNAKTFNMKINGNGLRAVSVNYESNCPVVRKVAASYALTGHWNQWSFKAESNIEGAKNFNHKLMLNGGAYRHISLDYESNCPYLSGANVKMAWQRTYNGWKLTTASTTKGRIVINHDLELSGNGMHEASLKFNSNCPHLRTVSASYQLTNNYNGGWTFTSNANIEGRNNFNRKIILEGKGLKEMSVKYYNSNRRIVDASYKLEGSFNRWSLTSAATITGTSAISSKLELMGEGYNHINLNIVSNYNYHSIAATASMDIDSNLKVKGDVTVNGRKSFVHVITDMSKQVEIESSCRYMRHLKLSLAANEASLTMKNDYTNIEAASSVKPRGPGSMAVEGHFKVNGETGNFEISHEKSATTAKQVLKVNMLGKKIDCNAVTATYSEEFSIHAKCTPEGFSNFRNLQFDLEHNGPIGQCTTTLKMLGQFGSARTSTNGRITFNGLFLITGRLSSRNAYLPLPSFQAMIEQNLGEREWRHSSMLEYGREKFEVVGNVNFNTKQARLAIHTPITDYEDMKAEASYNVGRGSFNAQSSLELRSNWKFASHFNVDLTEGFRSFLRIQTPCPHIGTFYASVNANGSPSKFEVNTELDFKPFNGKIKTTTLFTVARDNIQGSFNIESPFDNAKVLFFHKKVASGRYENEFRIEHPTYKMHAYGKWDSSRPGELHASVHGESPFDSMRQMSVALKHKRINGNLDSSLVFSHNDEKVLEYKAKLDNSDDIAGEFKLARGGRFRRSVGGRFKHRVDLTRSSGALYYNDKVISGEAQFKPIGANKWHLEGNMNSPWTGEKDFKVKHEHTRGFFEHETKLSSNGLEVANIYVTYDATSSHSISGTAKVTYKGDETKITFKKTVARNAADFEAKVHLGRSVLETNLKIDYNNNYQGEFNIRANDDILLGINTNWSPIRNGKLDGKVMITYAGSKKIDFTTNWVVANHRGRSEVNGSLMLKSPCKYVPELSFTLKHECDGSTHLTHAELKNGRGQKIEVHAEIVASESKMHFYIVMPFKPNKIEFLKIMAIEKHNNIPYKATTFITFRCADNLLEVSGEHSMFGQYTAKLTLPRFGTTSFNYKPNSNGNLAVELRHQSGDKNMEMIFNRSFKSRSVPPTSVVHTFTLETPFDVIRSVNIKQDMDISKGLTYNLNARYNDNKFVDLKLNGEIDKRSNVNGDLSLSSSCRYFKSINVAFNYDREDGHKVSLKTTLNEQVDTKITGSLALTSSLTALKTSAESKFYDFNCNSNIEYHVGYKKRHVIFTVRNDEKTLVDSYFNLVLQPFKIDLDIKTSCKHFHFLKFEYSQESLSSKFTYNMLFAYKTPNQDYKREDTFELLYSPLKINSNILIKFNGQSYPFTFQHEGFWNDFTTKLSMQAPFYNYNAVLGFKTSQIEGNFELTLTKGEKIGAEFKLGATQSSALLNIFNRVTKATAEYSIRPMSAKFSVTSDFPVIRSIELEASQRGSIHRMKTFTQVLKASYNNKHFEYRADMRNLDKLSVSLGIKTPYPGYDHMGIILREKVVRSEFITKITAYWSKSSNSRVIIDIKGRIGPNISLKLTAQTPFRGYRKVTGNISHKSLRYGFESSAKAQIGGKRYRGGMKVTFKGPQLIKADMNLVTPFRKFSNMSATFKHVQIGASIATQLLIRANRYSYASLNFDGKNERNGYDKDISYVTKLQFPRLVYMATVKCSGEGQHKHGELSLLRNNKGFKFTTYMKRYPKGLPSEGKMVLTTPFRGFEKLESGMTLETTPSKIETMRYFRWAPGKEVRFEVELVKPTKASLVITTPFNNWEELSFSAKRTFPGEGHMVGDITATYGASKKIQLRYNGKVHLNNYNRHLDIETTLTTPCRYIRELTVALKHESQPAGIVTSLTTSYNQKEVLNTMVQIGYYDNSLKVTKPIEFEVETHHQNSVYSLRTDVKGREVFELKYSAKDQARTNILELTTPNRHMKLDCRKGPDSKKVVFSWDVARGMKMGFGYQMNTAGYGQTQNEYSLITPLRVLQLQITKRGNRNVELKFLWDAEKDQAKAMSISNSLTPMRGGFRHVLRISHPQLLRQIVAITQMKTSSYSIDLNSSLKYSNNPRDDIRISFDKQKGAYSDELKASLNQESSGLDLKWKYHAKTVVRSSVEYSNSIGYSFEFKDAAGRTRALEKLVELTLTPQERKYKAAITTPYGNKRSFECKASGDIQTVATTECVYILNRLTYQGKLSLNYNRVDIQLPLGPNTNNRLHIVVDRPNKLLVWRDYGSRKIYDIKLEKSLDSARMFNVKFYWRPSMILDIRKAMQMSMNRNWHEYITGAMREMKQLRSWCKTMCSRVAGRAVSLSPLVSYIQKGIAYDLNRIRMEAIRMYQRNDFYIVRQIVHVAKPVYISIERAFFQVRDSARRLATLAKNKLSHTVSYVSNLLQILPQYVSAIRRKMLYVTVDYLYATGSFIATKASELGNLLRLIATYIKDALAENTYNIRYSPRYQQAVNMGRHVYEQAARRLGRVRMPRSVRAFDDQMRSSVSIARDQVRSTGAWIRNGASRVYDNVEPIVMKAYNNKAFELLRSTALEAYNKVHDSAVKYQLGDKALTLALNVLDRALMWSKDAALYAVDEYLKLDKDSIFYDPEEGHLEISAYLPKTLPRFQKFDFSVQEFKQLLRDAREFVNDIWPDTVTPVQLYYKFKPSLNPTDWIPPFKASASMSGSQHFVTFDGRLVTFSGPCEYVLAEDTTPKKSWSISVKNMRFDKTFNVRFGKKLIVVRKTEENNVVSKTYGDVTVTRKGDLVTVENERLGVKIHINYEHDFAQVEVAGWWFGKTGGLLGSYNNEPYDDLKMRDGKTARTVALFANSWSTRRCRSLRNSAKVPFSDVSQECSYFFESSSSPMSYAFKRVSPALFKRICTSDVEGEGDKGVCKSAALYARVSRNSGVPVAMPSVCAPLVDLPQPTPSPPPAMLGRPDEEPARFRPNNKFHRDLNQYLNTK